MNIVKKIFQNSVWLGAAQIGSRAFGLLIVMVLTRYLGAEGFGKYSFIYAYIDFFGVLTLLGIDTIIVREASRDLKQGERLAGNGIFLKAIFAVTALALAIITAKLAGYPADRVGLIALAALTFLAAPLSLYATVFPATLRLPYLAMVELIGRILSFIFIIVVVISKGTLVHIFIALLTYVFCQAALTVYLARPFFRPSFRIDFSLWRWLLVETIPLALTNLLILLILRIDQIMLKDMHPEGDFQLGLYSAAVKYCEVFNLLPIVYFASVFPLLSRLSTTKKESFDRLNHLSFKYLTMAIIPITLFSILHADWIMMLLFGKNFTAAADSMKILAWSIPFVFFYWVLNNSITSLGLQRALPPMIFAVAIANIVLNARLIPSYGAGGASLASLISYSLVLPLSALLTPFRPLAVAFIRKAVRPVAGGLLLWVILRPLALNPLIDAVVLLGGFFILMILTRALDKDDLALIRRITAEEGKKRVRP